MTPVSASAPVSHRTGQKLALAGQGEAVNARVGRIGASAPNGSRCDG